MTPRQAFRVVKSYAERDGGRRLPNVPGAAVVRMPEDVREGLQGLTSDMLADARDIEDDAATRFRKYMSEVKLAWDADPAEACAYLREMAVKGGSLG